MNNTQALYQDILSILATRPMPDSGLGLPLKSARLRLRELSEMRLIQDSGERHYTSTGCVSTVWELTDAGLFAVRR